MNHISKHDTLHPNQFSKAEQNALTALYFLQTRKVGANTPDLLVAMLHMLCMINSPCHRSISSAVNHKCTKCIKYHLAEYNMTKEYPTKQFEQLSPYNPLNMAIRDLVANTFRFPKATEIIIMLIKWGVPIDRPCNTPVKYIMTLKPGNAMELFWLKSILEKLHSYGASFNIDVPNPYSFMDPDERLQGELFKQILYYKEKTPDLFT